MHQSNRSYLELISHLFYPLGFHFHDARIFFCFSFSIPEWKGEQVFNAIFSHQDIYRSGKATMQKSMKQVFEREKSFAFFPLFLCFRLALLSHPHVPFLGFFRICCGNKHLGRTRPSLGSWNTLLFRNTSVSLCSITLKIQTASLVSSRRMTSIILCSLCI